jgi:diadenosine tetraphosphate (Ap4A) HIT family hydrolase
MNPTIEKFGYPATLVHEFEHWVLLLRPSQVTLGSLILAAKSNATSYGELPSEAFVEQRQAVVAIEAALGGFCAYERINYLMLMMVDPNVHFHVIPRYSEPRRWNDLEFADAGWPGVPKLDRAVKINGEQTRKLVSEIGERFR